MFDDFNVDFDSSLESAVKSAAGNYIDDIIEDTSSITGGFFDNARDIADDYGDPFGITSSVANDYINAAENMVNDALSEVQAEFGSYFDSGYSSKLTPYLRAAKRYIDKLMNTPFKQGWQWVIEADGTPPDFDIYVKDIDLGLGSIDADSTNIGSGSLSKPTSSNAGEITMTVRDHIDGRVARWFAKMLGKVKNKDGTVNLPINYVFNLRIFAMNEDGTKRKWKEYRVWAVSNSATLSYDSVNEHMTYTLTFQKFSSIGKKFL